MNRFFLIVAGLFLTFNLHSKSFASSDPAQLVNMTFNNVFTPVGFDSNDNVQVALDGWLPNSCYLPGPISWKLEGKNNIVVDAKAFVRQGICLQILIPRQHVLDLGVLKAGDYNVIAKSGESYGKLHVKEAELKNEDDFLYAPISQAYFRQENGKNIVLLNGSFTNSCLAMSDVRIDVQPSVIVIQPIAKMNDQGKCVGGQFPFEHVVELKDIKNGRFLLHVRSLNGKAINSIIDVRN